MKLSESYYFSSITSDAQQIELHNHNLKLSELNLINWTLKINEADKNDSEKTDNIQLGEFTSILIFDFKIILIILMQA